MGRSLTMLLWSGWLAGALCFWDEGTTTESAAAYDDEQRQSFFRWQYAHFETFWGIFPTGWAWDYGNKRRHRLTMVSGVSVEFIALTTAAIMNRRTVITSANPLEPYMWRPQDLRIWACGRGGLYYTPYRYRVWRARRVLPRSLNPEHQVGARGIFSTRHDVVILTTRDQMYIYHTDTTRYLYATHSLLTKKLDIVAYKEFWQVGSGFVSMDHIKGNFKIQWKNQQWTDVVNCERYLPKWWGKFICIMMVNDRAGVQSGGPLFMNARVLTAIGAFDIRYNEDRVEVFTDLRYYVDWINVMANISYGEYYDYAYQAFGVKPGTWFYDGNANVNFIPTQFVQYDLWPLGK